MSRILRFDDIESRLADPPQAGSRQRPLPERYAARLEIHRLRARRQALRAGRRAVQYLRARCRPLRGHHAHESPTARATRSIARGLRNSVGFDWDPRTRELWFTDNGRDYAGRRLPPDTLEPRAAGRDCNFGYPYCHAGTIPDPEFGQKRALRGVHAAGAEARSARRVARHALLHRDAVSRRVPQLRSSSPSTGRGTAAGRSATASRSCASKTTALSRTNRSRPGWLQGRDSVGPPGRRSRHAGRLAARVGRSTPERSIASAMQAKSRPLPMAVVMVVMMVPAVVRPTVDDRRSVVVRHNTAPARSTPAVAHRPRTYPP